MKLLVHSFIILLVSLFAVAQAANIEINPRIPGTEPQDNPVGIVGNLFQFALMIGGLLAFGAIVWGGIRYALAQGNPGAQTDARDQITQAVIGLLLLVSATLILQTISPGLASPGLPGLDDIRIPSSTPSTTTTTCDIVPLCNYVGESENKPACAPSIAKVCVFAQTCYAETTTLSFCCYRRTEDRVGTTTNCI